MKNLALLKDIGFTLMVAGAAVYVKSYKADWAVYGICVFAIGVVLVVIGDTGAEHRRVKAERFMSLRDTMIDEILDYGHEKGIRLLVDTDEGGLALLFEKVGEDFVVDKICNIAPPLVTTKDKKYYSYLTEIKEKIDDYLKANNIKGDK